MSIGVIEDLTAKAIAVGKRYSAQLQQTTKEKVSSTLDLQPLVSKMSGITESVAIKVNISQAARQKAVLSR
ncbi:MAG: hypothetical protein HQM02_03840 [Magnetococcales bacterium]|nr:hypothetical protein [Magnetococcales bacterium]